MNFGEMFKWSYRAHPTFMAYALPQAGQNPERALLFAKELLTNKELFQLYDMGIEGTHYKLEDGYYVSLNNPLNPGFTQSASGITNFLYRDDFKIYSKDYQWVLDYERDHMTPYEVTNYFEGFPEDYAPYRDKVTAMSEVNTQYTWPLLLGAMSDPIGALREANRRLDAAGRQEVCKNAVEQYQAYLDGLGIPK
jgi:putative aldouronate transport system substrate-binding protein